MLHRYVLIVYFCIKSSIPGRIRSSRAVSARYFWQTCKITWRTWRPVLDDFFLVWKTWYVWNYVSSQYSLFVSENPHPERGNVFSVRLSQKTDTVIYKHSETRIVIEQHFEVSECYFSAIICTFVQMNFAEMEWGRVRKTITHKQGKVLEKTEYISVLDLWLSLK